MNGLNSLMTNYRDSTQSTKLTILLTSRITTEFMVCVWMLRKYFQEQNIFVVTIIEKNSYGNIVGMCVTYAYIYIAKIFKDLQEFVGLKLSHGK